MNSRERLLAVFSQSPADRVAIDLGGTPASGIAAECYQRVKDRIGVAGLIRIDAGQQLACVDQAVARKLRIDTRQLGPVPARWREWTFPGWLTGQVDAALSLRIRPDGSQQFTAVDGTEWEIAANGWGFHQANRPLQGATTAGDIERYYQSLPQQCSQEQVQAILAEAQLAARGDRCVVGAFPVAAFESWRLRGLENFLMDFLAEPEMAEVLMKCHAEYTLSYWLPALRAAGPALDVLFVGDDLASQQGLLVSEDLYRRYVRPIQKWLWEQLRRLAPQARLLVHSCGAVEPLIRDFIDMGAEALNPVQTSATGMDAAHLKKEYGGDIVLWGGGIDPQGVLLHGSVSKVKEEVRRRLDLLARDGGFVFAPTCELQPATPVENVLAMLEAVGEF
jgi:uroporphyrinogen decarboxylase